MRHMLYIKRWRRKKLLWVEYLIPSWDLAAVWARETRVFWSSGRELVSAPSHALLNGGVKCKLLEIRRFACC